MLRISFSFSNTLLLIFHNLKRYYNVEKETAEPTVVAGNAKAFYQDKLSCHPILVLKDSGEKKSTRENLNCLLLSNKSGVQAKLDDF